MSDKNSEFRAIEEKIFEDTNYKGKKSEIFFTCSNGTPYKTGMAIEIKNKKKRQLNSDNVKKVQHKQLKKMKIDHLNFPSTSRSIAGNIQSNFTNRNDKDSMKLGKQKRKNSCLNANFKQCEEQSLKNKKLKKCINLSDDRPKNGGTKNFDYFQRKMIFEDNLKKPSCKDSLKKKKKINITEKELENPSSSDSDLNDWEDINCKGSKEISNEIAILSNAGTSGISDPSSSVEIELDTSELWGRTKKKKSEEEMVEDFLRKSVNREVRENFVNCHKVHVLLLLGHGLHLNRILSCEELLASALSVVTSKHIYPPKRTNLKYVEQLVKWYHKKMKCTNAENESKPIFDFKSILMERFETRNAASNKEFVLMFVVVCRALGISVRLVLSLLPLSWKPTSEYLFKHTKDKKIDKSHSKNDIGSSKIKVSHKQSKSNLSGLNKFFVSSNKNEVLKQKPKITKHNVREWVEMYVEEVEKWVCVDVINSKIFSAVDIISRVPPPVGYITAFNPDQTVKDVTKKYIRKWLSIKSKVQCDCDWWQKVLSPYTPFLNRLEREENESMEEVLRKQPLPQTLSEYKNNPLYCLQRHLLKHESLYPPNPDPIGFVKGEPVFSRECVKTLHSRDFWLKKAKTVVVGEEPYKIVSARPKWDKVACTMIKDRPLELFGEWQVEKYKPPIAKDGKVPRNEYGNVELFTPEMLPVGCVHLSSYFEDIGRICKKLMIDCAPAMVGFDFHKGGSHPVFDGYVVCEEYEEILKDAWKEEMQLKKKREEIRREKRVIGNWKRLVNSLLVKHRLRETYGNYDEQTGIVSDKKGNSKSKIKQNHDNKQKKQNHDKNISSSARSSHSNVKNVLNIDLKSDTVAMAKSFYKNIKKGSIVYESAKEKAVDSSDDEEKYTDEQRSERLRKILNWGEFCSERDGSDLVLSDESDNDGSNQKSIVISDKIDIKTSPSSNISNEKLKKNRTLNRTNLKRKVSFQTQVCTESEDDDISLDESDLEDKTYEP